MSSSKQLKSERKGIYFDIICGITSSVIALTGIACAVIFNRVASIGWFTISVTFWGGYLAFSFFLIGLGIYSWYKEKNLDKYQPKNGLRAPVV